jgi:hypothetical protein
MNIDKKINAMSLKQVFILASILALIFFLYQNKEQIKSKLE